MKHGDAMTLGAVAVLAAASLAGQRGALKRQRRGSAAKGTRFVVRTPEAGLKLIRSKTYTDNWREALGVKPKHPVAVLVPCAGTKPFSQAPSHKHGYMPALEGLDVDRWVVAEPLGVVPWAWQDRYPNDAYDYPPDQLRGPARDLLIERIREWLERVGTRYERLVAALPGHHMALVREANAGVGLAIEDASITACRKSSCSRETFRATSRGYRKWLRERVR